jgi:hypothetical protein
MSTDIPTINAIHTLSDDLLRASFERTSEILSAGERRGYAQEFRSARDVQFLSDSIHRTENHLQDAFAQYGQLNYSATERNADAIRETTAALGVQNERLANEMLTNLSAHDRQVSNLFYSTTRDAGRDFGHLMTEIARLGCKVEKEAADIKIQAAENKGDLIQAMAQCCCEIKEKVGSTSTATQALIQSTDNGRLRDALYAATANQANQHCRPHYFPFPPPGPQ